MQIERLFANSNLSKKRRPSYITVNSVSPSSVETLLSTRTAKSISKSRRSSLVAEVLGGGSAPSSTPSSSASSSLTERTATSTNTGCIDVGVSIGSRRSSLINFVYEKAPFPEGEYTFPPTDESMEYTTMDEDETPSDFFSDHPYQYDQQAPISFSSSSSSSSITQPSSSRNASDISNDGLSLAAIVPRPRSSSITPIIQETSSLHLSSQAIHFPTFDHHTMYKIKKKKSSGGSDALHHDLTTIMPGRENVSIQGIKTDGLSAMLESKIPLCYFLHHLLEEYSSENLFFFLELQQYDIANYASVSQQLASAQHIYDIYLSRNSPFEVNLDDKVRSDITMALDERSVKGCFRTAKRAVFLLLESSFMQFMRTSHWNQMVENCGESTACGEDERKEKAVNNLIVYLERSQASMYATQFSMTGNSSARKHYDIVKTMVHDFCRTLLGIEFDYYRPETAPLEDQTQKSSPVSPQLPRRGLKHKHVVLFDFFGKKRPH